MNLDRIFSLSTSLRCSLRCRYCASGFDSAQAQRRPVLLEDIGADRYLYEIDRLPIPEDALINFHGPAEPLEDPHFEQLFVALYTGEHTMRVYTNLIKSEPLVDLVSGYECQGRAGGIEIAASYPVGAYRNKRERHRVRTAIYDLIGTRAFVRLMVPATPAALAYDGLEDDLRGFASTAEGRFQVSMIALGNAIGVRPYPDSYTDAELLRFAELARAYGAWQPLPKRLGNLREMGAPLRLKGQPCLYPSIHAAVGIDGRIWNCGPANEPERRLGEPIGRLYATGPVPCPHPVCTCKPRGVEYCLEARGITLEEHLGLPGSEGGQR